MFKKAIKAVALALCVTMFAGSMDTTAATMRKDVLAGEKTLPGSGEFNVIAEPFDWGKDVTRIMLNTGSRVLASDLNVSDFDVTGKHYSEQAYKDDFNGKRNVTDVYPVNENGEKSDSGDYVMLELEYGSGVQGAHTGSYNYANYYTPLKLTYTVKWNGQTYAQHEVVNILCDDFKLDRYVDKSISNANYNFCDYAFFTPSDTTSKKRPLIIFFHGMGEGGARDLKNQGVQMYAYPEANFASPEIQKIMGGGAYVLLPQSPDRWPTNGFTEESGYLEVVNSLIDNIIDNNPGIDTDRIYVGGLSMGGYMASRVILNRPEKYAAAFLCSQAYAITEEDAAKLKNLPIWISCSEADHTCSMDPYTYASYVKLVEGGSKEAKCVVMEKNNTDSTSRYRFYSSDSANVDDYVMYYPSQDKENEIKGDFVWDNVSYSGHNGGWVPVFANGEFYEKEDGTKVTIMDWLAFHTLRGIEDPNADNNKETATQTPAPANPGQTGTVTNVPQQTKVTEATSAPAVITLDKSKVTLFKKGLNKAILKAEVSSGESISWSSSNSKVASVNKKGQVTAKKAGKAVITATVGNAKAECTVTVKNASFKIKKKSIVVKKGKKAKIACVVSPKKAVKYKASSKNIKVTSKGVVTGVKKGKAVVTVTYMGVKQTVKVKVK